MDHFESRSWKMLLVLGLLVATAGTILLLVVRFPLNHDVAWLMSMTRRVLGGEQLYRDIVEVNPPLVAYMLIPPVLLSDAVGLSDSASVQLLVLGVTTCAIVWYLRLTSPRTGGGSTVWWIALLCFGLLAVPAGDFGQREHLMLLLTLPFLAVKWRRICHLETGTAESALAGGLGGLGFAIKPHFVLIWLALEAYGWFGRGRDESHVRPESLAVAATLTLYLIFVVTVHPAYLEMMIEIAPLYTRFSSGTSQFFVVVYFAIQLLAIVAAATVARMERRDGNLVAVFLVFAGAGLGVVLIQGKGWRYHSLPMIIGTVFAWGAVFDHGVAAVMSGMRRPGRLRGAFAVAMLLPAVYLSGLVTLHAFKFARESRTASLERARNVSRYDPDSIVVLGDAVDQAYPLVNLLEARSVSPFPSLWWLRALYGTGEVPTRALATGHRTSSERRLSRLFVADFVETPPDLVLVDTAHHQRFGGEAFPYIEYFGSDPVFARVWNRYERAGAVDEFAIWRASDSQDPEEHSELQRDP